MPEPIDPVLASAADLPSDVVRRLVTVYAQLADDGDLSAPLRAWYRGLPQGPRDVHLADLRRAPATRDELHPFPDSGAISTSYLADEVSQ